MGGYLPYRRAFYDRLLAKRTLGCRGELIDNKHLYNIAAHAPVNITCFLLLVLGFTFGPGYQPISFFFIPTIVLMVLYTRSCPSLWHVALVVWPSVTLGQFFAYAATFVTQTNLKSPWESGNTIYALPISAGVSALMCLALVSDRGISKYSHLTMPFIEIFFGFPMIWTGFWCIMSYFSPFGDYGNWGFALSLLGIDSLTLGVTFLFGAISGGAFCFSVAVSSLVYLLRRYVEIYYPDPHVKNPAIKPATPVFLASDTEDCKNLFTHPIACFLYFIVVVYSFGNLYQTFGPYPTMFYQTPIAMYAPQTVQMSCLINGTIPSTIHHMRTSGSESKFVIWSEESISISADDESLLLEQGKAVSKNHSVYLGIAYQLQIDSPPYTSRNMFTLIVPPSENSTNARIGFRYQKTNTIPFIESLVEPGPEVGISYVDTPYGRIGGSICFDFDFKLMRNAYANDISIMLQPSWTWGPIGSLHASINRLVSVENGFTQFRCTANGISGVNDAFYRVLSQQITVESGEDFIYKVPIVKKKTTIYRVLPDYLGIVCMAFLVFWVCFICGWAVTDVHRKRYPKKLMTAEDCIIDVAAEETNIPAEQQA